MIAALFCALWSFGCLWLLAALQPPRSPLYRDPGEPIMYPGHVWRVFHASQSVSIIPDGGYEANPSHKVPPG